MRYGIRQLESKGLLQERRAQFLARREFLERVMKVAGTSADEGSSTAKSPNGKTKQGKVSHLFDCSERKVKDGQRDRQDRLEKCLNMGLDIMRQQAPQEKKKQ